MKTKTVRASLTIIFIICAIYSLGWLTNSSVNIKGGCDQSFSSFLQPYNNEDSRITYCTGGDKFTTKIISDYFKGHGSVRFSYSGYPETSQISPYWEQYTGERTPISLSNTGEKWERYESQVPRSLQGKQIRLVMDDQSQSTFGWIGVTDIEVSFFPFNLSNIVKAFMLLVSLHCIFSIWLVLFLRRNSHEVSLALQLLTIGLFGYITFFVFLSSVTAGITLSITVLILLLCFFVKIIINDEIYEFVRAHKIWLPISLYTAFIVFIGYYPFVSVSPDSWMTAGHRWLGLPIDNWIPKIFADQILAGQVMSPMLGDWLSSDRPPLQTGILLIFYSLMPGDTLLYQILSTMLQVTIIFPAFIFLRVIGQRKVITLIVMLLLTTNLVAIHSLHVWPKLLSATYLMLFYLLLLTPFKLTNEKAYHYMVAGCYAALAMLSHGGAVFALFGIGVAFLIKNSTTKALITSVKTTWYYGFWFLLLMAPWIYYQKFIDPFNDRLAKWHIAGVIEPNKDSLRQSILSAYQSLDFFTWLDGRIINLRVIFGGTIDFLVDILNLSVRDQTIITKSFYGTTYSFWFLSPFIIFSICAASKRRNINMDMFWILITSLIIEIAWSLVMFIPGSTVIHQGTFFPWIATFIACATMLHNINIVIFYLLAGANFIIFSLLYVFDKAYTDNHINYPYLIAAVLLFVLLFRAARPERIAFDLLYADGRSNSDDGR